MGKSKRPGDRLSKLQVLKLQQSINAKDVDQIVKLISNGVPDLVNIGDCWEGSTGIHLAACTNDVDIIKLLYDHGADINTIDNNGKNVFMMAAEFGYIESLSVLLKLEMSPDLDAKDNDGRDILFYCLHDTTRHQLCLKLAIEYGADINVVSHEGSTALFEAVTLKLTDMVELLLEEGASANVMNEKRGETCLHVACKEGLTDIVRLLLKYGGDPDVCDKAGNHCAHMAVRKGGDRIEIFRLLSAYHSHLGTINLNQETAMHVAAKKGIAGLCKFLGQRGCPANTQNKKGDTPRMLAKDRGHKLALKACKKAEKQKGEKRGTQYHLVQFYDWLQEHTPMLITGIHDYDPNQTGMIKINDILNILKIHKSPLSEERLSEILRSHLTEGTDVNYELFLSGKKFIHKSFLIKGKKKEKTDKGGRRRPTGGPTKIGFPICLNSKPSQTRLEESGPLMNFVERQEHVTDRCRFDRGNQPTHQIKDDSFWYLTQHHPSYIHVNEAVKNRDFETLKVAILNGYDVNEKDQYYKTPLMLACLEGNYELAHFLIAHGADIRMTDNFKWSAIHFACHSGQTDLVELLTKHGADIEAQTLNGGTPLMRAIESAQVDVVQLLIDKGAKVYVKTKKGLNALQIAKSYADLRIVNMLEKRLLEDPPPVEKKKRKNAPSPIKPGANKIGTHPTILPDIKSKNTPEISKSRKTTFASTAASLDSTGSEKSTVSFQVQQAWLPQLDTDQLLAEKSKSRDRYGYLIDFEDYKPPFQSNIDKLLNEAIT